MRMTDSELLDQIERKVKVSGVDGLVEPERVLWLISWAEFEVALGGVSTYLSNSAGNFFPLLPEALSAAGCSEAAASAERLRTLLRRYCPNFSDRDERNEVLYPATGSTPPELENAMDEFGSILMKMEHGDALRSYLERQLPDLELPSPSEDEGQTQ
jgi:hypothetical protein